MSLLPKDFTHPANMTQSVELLTHWKHQAHGVIVDLPDRKAHRIWGENNLGPIEFEHVDFGTYHFTSDRLFKSGLTNFIVLNDINCTCEYSVLDENTLQVLIKEGGGNLINNRLLAAFWIAVYHSQDKKDDHLRFFGAA